MKKRNAILEETMKEAYSMKTIKCKCGCNETYVRKNEEEFRKTNLKHLISQRDKLINDVEHLKGKVEREERTIYYNNDENSDDGYYSDTTGGQPPAMLEEAEEQLKEVEEVLKSLSN
jgi:hypothetical protein